MNTNNIKILCKTDILLFIMFKLNTCMMNFQRSTIAKLSHKYSTSINNS